MALQRRKRTNFWAQNLRNLVEQPGVGQIKKTRRFLVDLAICPTMHLSCVIRDHMRTQELTSKFGLLPRGLIHSVCNSKLILCSLFSSLSPCEGASGSGLRFSWFGEERHGKSSWVLGVGPRSQIQRTKNQRLFSKSIEIPPILKTLAGYDRSRASYLGNLLSELRSDQTLLSYSRKPEKRLLLFQRCKSFIARVPDPEIRTGQSGTRRVLDHHQM